MWIAPWTPAKKRVPTIISRDAKATVLGDIAPVQRPGRSWRRDVLTDHTWDQSQTNAVTPMTFLFLQTKYSLLFIRDVCTSFPRHNRETDKNRASSNFTESLVFLSLKPSNISMRYMYCHYFHYLHLSETNRHVARRRSLFVVGQWTSRATLQPAREKVSCPPPDSPTTSQVKQVSFEYHSKRNFVERVHAEENRVLSKHGPIKSS